ncbi:MAG: hypothetical protein H7319_15940 [Spirosoma sp.]|nr:hypothetical protein [Spirosoma sp.]
MAIYIENAKSGGSPKLYLKTDHPPTPNQESRQNPGRKTVTLHDPTLLDLPRSLTSSDMAKDCVYSAHTQISFVATTQKYYAKIRPEKVIAERKNVPLFNLNTDHEDQ